MLASTHPRLPTSRRGLLSSALLLACPRPAAASLAGGVAQGTLASCQGAAAECLSTYDDTPGRFAAPWEFEGAAADALETLAAAVEAEGGSVALRDDPPGYLLATFPAGDGDSLTAEFLLVSDGDSTVELRCAAPRRRGLAAALPDGRASAVLAAVRRRTRWSEVFVLRNRQGLLPLETPGDGFGPTPPVGGVDYGRLDDDLGAVL